jgi:pimeloyl-ACP methyl ester carboxylesterase
VRYIAEYSIKETKDGWRWRFDEVVFTSLERLFEYHYSFSCPAFFVHGANSLLTSGYLLDNVKSMYGNIMEFIEIPDAAHHVPLDKPHEVIKLIKDRCR